MSADPMAVWAEMTVKTWPERYWMLAIDASDVQEATSLALGSAESYCALIRDQGRASLITDEASVRRIATRLTVRERVGPFRMVSTDGELPFDVVGFLRPVLEVLNNAGIKAGPQCGIDHDHLFVYEDRLEDVHRIVSDFIATATTNHSKSSSVAVPR